MRSILILPCLVLAACGGGGGSPAPADGPSSSQLGSRSVPGGAIAVERIARASFRITSDVAGVQRMEALVGNDYEAAIPLALDQAPDGGWTGSAPVGSSLLVRMIKADGTVIESAVGDFTVR